MSKDIPNPHKFICVLCKDIVYSKYYGQFVRCKCGKVAVDEGVYSCRILGNKEDYSEVEVEEDKSN